MMLCDRLMELRANEALDKEMPTSDFSKIFNNKNNNQKTNPVQKRFGIGGRMGNPFGNGRGYNPFN